MLIFRNKTPPNSETSINLKHNFKNLSLYVDENCKIKKYKKLKEYKNDCLYVTCRVCGSVYRKDDLCPTCVSKFNKNKNIKTFSHFLKQSDIPEDFMDFQKMLGSIKSSFDEYTVKLIEDIAVCILNLSQSTSWKMFSLQLVTFIKFRSNKSLASDVENVFMRKFKEIFSDARQFDSNIFSQMRSMFEHYDKFKDTPLFKKLHSFFMFCLTFQILERFNITFDSMCYNEMEAKAIKMNFCNRLTFMHCILDTLTFILERGVQCFRLGSIDPLIHSSESYEKWYIDAASLKSRSKLMYNSTLHQVDRFKLEADLLSIIEKGDCIMKYTKVSSLERHFFLKELCELKMIKSDLLTKRDALKRRRMPYGILIYGSSSIGKTMFTEIVQTHYCKKRGLPLGSEFMYSLNEKMQHWDGFQSYMHSIIMDDVANIRPHMAPPGGDATLTQIIQIMNEAVMLPPMADLPDKGRNPVKCEFVAATTNVMSLNAGHYFNFPVAVQRRLPHVVHLKIKPEFATNNMLDSNKVPVIGENEYVNIWNIDVYRVSPDPQELRKANYMLLHNFTDVYDFIRWFNASIDEHVANCERKEAASNTVQDLSLCEMCYMPVSVCTCAQLDNLDHTEEEKEEPVIELDTSRMRRDEQTTYRYPWPDGRPDVTIAEVGTFWDWFVGLRIIFDNTIGHLWTIGLWFLSEELTFFLYRFLNLFISIVVSKFAFGYVYILLCTDFWHYLFNTPSFKARVIRTILFYIDKRKFAAMYGESVYNHIYKNKEKIMFQTILLTVSAIAMIMVGKRMQEKRTKEATAEIKKNTRDLVRTWDDQEKQEQECINMHAEDFDVRPKFQSQVKVFVDEGRVPAPQEKERVNVWVKNDYELTPFDLTPQITSSKVSASEFLDKIKNNCIRLECRRSDIPDRYVAALNALGLCDQYYVVNNHLFDVQFDEVFIIDTTNENIGSRINFVLEDKYIWKFPELDLAIIKILRRSPVSDIRKWFPSETYRARHHGMLGIRERDGSFTKEPVHQISYRHQAACFNGIMNFFIGMVSKETKMGDCGSPLVTETPMGTLILGIHMMGSEGMVASAIITKEFLDKFFCDRMLISACKPQMSSESVKRELLSLHYKSEINFMDHGEINVFGSFPRGLSKNRTCVENTPMNSYFAERGYQTKFAAPVMKGWEPWRNGLKPLIEPLPHIDHKLLRMCRKSFVADVIKNLPADQWQHIHVLDDDTTVFGAEGIAYLDRINMQSSAGNPWKRCKKFLFTEELGKRGMRHELKERYDDIINMYKMQRRYSPIFCNHLKDEPRSFKKIQSCNTRIFSGGPVDWILVQRKYLLALVRVMQNNKFVFECAPGTNAHSVEWQEIFHWMTVFGLDQLIGGDFQHFDKSLQCLILREAYKFLIAICKHAGYSPLSLLVLKGIMIDTIFAFSEFNGTLLEFLKGNPSGHALTVIINCISLSLIFRYCYARLAPRMYIWDKEADKEDIEVGVVPLIFNYRKAETLLREFRQFVRLMTYGDDNILAVHKERPWFNHTALVGELSEIGMIYTMANKEEESKPYIHMNELTFLKRSWKYDPDIGAIVGPLDHESIEKMIMVWNRSKTISKEEQCLAILDSALREYFFYGIDIFEYQKRMFEHAVEFLELSKFQTNPFPTWVQLNDAFWERDIITKEMNEAFEHMSPNMKPESSYTCSYCTYGTCHFCRSVRMDTYISRPERSSESLVSEGEGWAPSISEASYQMRISVPSIYLLNKQENFKKYQKRNWLNKLKRYNFLKCSKQSDTIMTFHDEVTGNKLDIPHGQEETQTANYTELSSLKDFLKRPTLISTITWVVGTPFTAVDVYPWQLFLLNTRIKKKLDNFNFLRGRLHVKAIVSCSPFYYGLMQLAYRPYQGLTYNPEISSTNFMPFSQRPSIWVVPGENKGGEMILPFFYNKDWVDITASSNAGDLGRFKVIEYVPLQSANGVAVEDVTIQLYAWLEDVQICGPTINLAMQMDEYKESPVQKTANTVANVASKLKSAPLIGSFAVATESAAKAVGSVASLFGFSDPPNIDVIHGFKNLPFHGMASADLSEPVSKLTLDSKSELSIDPKIVGLDGQDELDIDYIVSKYSYVTQFTWSSTDSVTTLKFQVPVTPSIFNKQTAIGTNVYPYSWTPSGHLAQMFANWRGGITFKILIIASKYHRGRLLFTWDPVGDLTTTSDTVNQAFTKLLDIGESREYEITVPYLQARPWLVTEFASNFSTISNLFQTSGFTNNVDTRRHNGSISLRVQNLLLAPVTNAPINVLIFQKCAPDFEFANPAFTSMNNFQFFVPQSEVIQDDDVKKEVDSSTLFNEKENPKTFMVNFADPIKSIRLLLRRATAVDLISMDAGTSGTLVKTILRHSRFPPFTGYNSNSPYNGASSLGGANSPYYFGNMTPYNWMFPCYIGQRGAVRWYYNLMPGANVPFDHMKVSRDVNAVTSGIVTTSSATSIIAGSQPRMFIGGISTQGVSGQVIMNQRTQTGLAVEFPMQSWTRMYHCEVASAWTGKSLDESNTDCYKAEFLYYGSTGGVPHQVTRYFSIGSDFNFHFYLNAPDCYYCAIPAAV